MRTASFSARPVHGVERRRDVAPWAAVVIGGVAAPIMMLSISFVERRLKVDDPVGAVSVHGAAGLWGLLAVGIFANGSYGDVSGLVAGNTEQILAQFISMATVTVWAFGTGLAIFWAIKKSMGLRASRQDELEGLDEHGALAYPEGIQFNAAADLSADGDD